MKFKFWLVLFLVIFITLQATVMTKISIFGVHPNIMILFTALMGSLLGARRGSLVGFFAGLLRDIATVNIFGISVLAYTLVGFFTGRIKESSMSLNNRSLWVISGLFGTILGTVLYVFFVSIIGTDYLFCIHSYIVVSVVTTFNTIAAIPVASLLRRFIPIDAFNDTWTL